MSRIAPLSPKGGLFAFETEDDGWLSLRYDLTAPLARAYAAQRAILPLPFKRQAIGPVWRNDKPGPGRLREFWQCDIDVVGTASLMAEIDVLDALSAGLDVLGLSKDTQIALSDRRLLDKAMDMAGIENSARIDVARALDAFDKLGATGVKDRLGNGRTDASGDFTPGMGLSDTQIDCLLAFLLTKGETAQKTLRALETLLGANQALEDLDRLVGTIANDRGIINPAIVRGMSYYTGTVFEIDLTTPVFDSKGKPTRMGALGGGGRYDGLVCRFTGQDVPAVGGSIGFDRAMLARSLLSIAEAPTTPLVCIMGLNPSYDDFTVELARLVRQSGLRTDVYVGNQKALGQRLKYADSRDAAYAVIVGGDEWSQGLVIVKDLQAGKAMTSLSRDAWQERPTQFTVPISGLVQALTA